MRKTIAVVIALLFLLGFTSFTFAQEKKHKITKTTQENVEIIRGKVISVDSANKQLVVRDNKTQTDKTFAVSEKAIKAVKVGDEVKVKVKAGTNQVVSVKIIKSEPQKKQ
jgi:hypothetical protein